MHYRVVTLKCRINCIREQIHNKGTSPSNRENMVNEAWNGSVETPEWIWRDKNSHNV
jgi:hypothetical protein